MTRNLLFTVLLALLWGAPISAQEPRPLVRVAIKEAPPFVIRRAGGGWEGISVDLWRVLAERLDINYELREQSLERLLENVQSGVADAGVAALTISPEREQRMDFSHPFYSTGYGVALADEFSRPWLSVARRFFTLEFLQVVAALVGLLAVIGVLIWLLERRRNGDEFDPSATRGVGGGLWWAAVSMTTVGYGDKAPITFWGRVLALVWMFASVILVSTFTAAITSALTVGELESLVRGPGDLQRLQVGVVEDTAGARYLRQQQVGYFAFETLEAALESLDAGNIQVVLHDAPLLRYRIAQDYASRLRMLSQVFSRQDYGIALPEDSPLQEPLDRALLGFVGTPEWRDILFQYLDRRSAGSTEEASG